MLNIGDAVLTFLGDTTQLDQVFARLPAEAEASMGTVAASVGAVNFELDATGSNAAYAGGMIEEEMGKAAVGTELTGKALRDAKGEAGLLGEMFNVHLPRHVRSFVAELPGVGMALHAAFAATAVVFLVEALVNVSGKLGDFIAKTLVYTQAMKDSDALTVKANQSLIAHAEAIDAATKALQEYGNTAAQKTQTAIEANNNSWAQNTAKIRLNREESEKLKSEQSGVATALGETKISVLNSILSWSAWSLGLDENTYRFKDNTKAMQENDAAYVELMKSQQQLALQIKVLDLQLRDEEDAARKATLAKEGAFDQAKIGGAKIVGSALLALQKAQAEALVAFDDGAAVKRLMIDRTFAEAEYQLTLSTHKQKLAAAQQAEAQLYQIEQANLTNLANVQKTMGAEGVKAAEATQVRIIELAKSHNLQLKTESVRGNAEIETLEKQHETKLINDATKFENEFQQIIKAAFSPGSSRGLGAGLGQEAQIFQQIADAAAKLGVTLESSLVKALNDAKKSYDVLRASGLVSVHDLTVAELKLLQTRLALNKSMGDVSAVKATDKAITDLTKKLKTMEGEFPKVKSGWDTFTADFKKKAKEMQTESQTMGKTVADAAFQMQHAFESAMASAILSQSSFGEALKEGTAQVLAQLSAQAAVHAVYSLALGFLKEAQYDFVGAHLAFVAAAEFGILAGAAGAAAHGMAGGGSSSSSSSPAMSTGPATQPAVGGGQGANVPHLAAGALITGPTLAMLGEGDSREAVIPLSDGSALNAIAEAIAKHGGGGGTNFYIKGMVSSDTVGKMAKKLSRQVQTGRTRLTASNTHKITRRA